MSTNPGGMSPHSMAGHLSQEMQEAIKICLDCHSICLETIIYCLGKGGKHAEVGHVRLMLDCAEMCQTCANFMLRDSELHGRVCGVCAEVCERCARSCDQFTDDSRMRECADTCRRCAESCRRMAAS